MKSIFSQIKRFDSVDFKEGKEFSFTLNKINATTTENTSKTDLNNTGNKIHTNNEKMQINENYKVTVKKYMTEKATPQFDFQDKWNNNIPMPMCIMQGEVIKETRGMVYMSLQGKAEPSCNCFVCGKTLSNPISKIYGIGPECSAKIGLMRIETEDEAREMWKDIVAHLEETRWEGWIIKSAIKEWKEI